MTTGPAVDEFYAVAADLRQRVDALAPYEQGLLIALDWLLGTGAAHVAVGRTETWVERRVAHGRPACWQP